MGWCECCGSYIGDDEMLAGYCPECGLLIDPVSKPWKDGDLSRLSDWDMVN